MISGQGKVYWDNALKLLAEAAGEEPRVNEAVKVLLHQELETGIVAGIEDFLSNPFIQTALSILETFQKNYKVGQAIKLLKEAGKEFEEETRKKKKKR